MILDTERNLLAVENEYIFLSTLETIILDLIIGNNKRGISAKEIGEKIYTYSCDVIHIVCRIKRKIHKYAEIYQTMRRYRIYYYGKGIHL